MTLSLWCRGETEAEARACAEEWARAEPKVVSWSVIGAEHGPFDGVWYVDVEIRFDEPPMTLGLVS